MQNIQIEAAGNGTPEQQYDMGNAYREKGGKENLQAAVACYEKAAQRGLLVAQLRTADIYWKLQDLKQAMRWYHKLAVQNYSYAQYMLGQCYEKADWEKNHEEKALFWFQTAAEQNNDDALFKLGEIYENGLLGVAVGCFRANEYYRQAYENGNQKAKGKLRIWKLKKGLMLEAVQA